MIPESSSVARENSQPLPFNPTLLAKLEGTTHPIFSLDWSPDGRILASAGDSKIRVWDAVAQIEIAAFQGHDMDIWGLAWSSDGSILASAGQDGLVKLWYSAVWHTPINLEIGEWAFCVSWSPDGKFLTVGNGTFTDPSRPETYKGLAQIWDIGKLQRVRELRVSAPIISIGWSPQGRTIAIGQLDGRITLWDGESDSAQKFFLATTERSDVNGLAWSPDGRILASAHQDGRVRLWNPETGAVLKTLDARSGWLRGLTWSPDANLLAAAGEAAEIALWRPDSGKILARLPSNSLPIWSLDWSPDGNWLAAGNGLFVAEPNDSSVRIYKMPVEIH